MDKIPVVVLGATGIVGQRFISLLSHHPWFSIVGLVGSDRSAGQPYGDAVNWVIAGDPPEELREMSVLPLDADLPGRVAFSALPSDTARTWEPLLAEKGLTVCSNASAFRLEPDVPMIIPEVNADHLDLLNQQKKNRGWKGLLVTSPNCTTTGMVLPLKPLHQAWEVDRISVVSLQAASGAGHPGESFIDLSDNLLPYIPGEEDKLDAESRALLGSVEQNSRVDAPISVSAQANRAPLRHGHTLFLSVGFQRKPSPQEAIEAMAQFRGLDEGLELPSAPAHPLIVRREEDRPQPRRDRDNQGGMVVTVGRVRSCPVLDLRMVSVVHNALRGAAGGAILNAELLVAKGWVQ